jgi:hypothetical protein
MSDVLQLALSLALAFATLAIEVLVGRRARRKPGTFSRTADTADDSVIVLDHRPGETVLQLTIRVQTAQSVP